MKVRHDEGRLLRRLFRARRARPALERVVIAPEFCYCLLPVPLEHCSSRKIAECLDVIRVNPRRIDRVGFKGQRRPGGIVVLIRERGNWPARKREGTGGDFSA